MDFFTDIHVPQRIHSSDFGEKFNEISQHLIVIPGPQKMCFYHHHDMDNFKMDYREICLDIQALQRMNSGDFDEKFSEISQHLLDGLAANFQQLFLVPRRCSTTTIKWTFFSQRVNSSDFGKRFSEVSQHLLDGLAANVEVIPGPQLMCHLNHELAKSQHL